MGVLIERDTSKAAKARFLMTSRPEGKVYAGYWEFPGGKLEAGRDASSRPCAASCTKKSASPSRQAHPWQVELMDYPHARVRLHFCKVFAWEGEFEMREGQQMAWQSLPVESVPVLPGTIPVLQWLAAERGHEGPTHLG